MPNWDSINKVMQEVADRESKVVSVRAESIYPTDGSQLSALIYTATARIAELEAALQCVFGYVNTPISRRRLNIKDPYPEWLTQAIATLNPPTEEAP